MRTDWHFCNIETVKASLYSNTQRERISNGPERDGFASYSSYQRCGWGNERDRLRRDWAMVCFVAGWHFAAGGG